MSWQIWAALAVALHVGYLAGSAIGKRVGYRRGLRAATDLVGGFVAKFRYEGIETAAAATEVSAPRLYTAACIHDALLEVARRGQAA